MAAEMRQVVLALRRMNTEAMSPVYLRELNKAARPFAPRVRAAIINAPAKGPKTTGLRARIARCVQTWARAEGTLVQIGIEIDSSRMPDGQKSLPLMMDGRKIWRHPVFGDYGNWVTQMSHPYFDEAMAGFGPATKRALERATEEIARIIDSSSG
jgi:hypothetical protein